MQPYAAYRVLSPFLFRQGLVNQKSNKVRRTGRIAARITMVRETDEIMSSNWRRGRRVHSGESEISSSCNEGQMSMATPLEKQVPWGFLTGRP